ncbi:MAG TPA: NAD(P)-dependent oxidoreductase [Acidimicrobiales bacterium]|nr:NAD(P)-dependent oxidoreductase [Acidimicrobiales bacterium]
MSGKRVVITGAAGVVGHVLRTGLAARRDVDVVGLDRRRVRGSGLRRVAMSNGRAVDRVFRDADVVIDLASAHWQEPWEAVRDNNIPSIWNALEAARRSGVRRLVFASSNHAVGGYEREEPYARVLRGDYGDLRPEDVPKLGIDVEVRPDTPYGVGKIFGEAAARYFAEHFGMSVICLRIGTLNWSGRPENPRQFSTLITHPDMVRLAEACIDAPPEVGFAILYGVSANTWRIWDLEAGRRIGFEPQDDAETWRGLDG